MTTELSMLAWTVVLGLVQLVITAQFFTLANGLAYAMGPRDTPAKPMNEMGERFLRAYKNLIETFPFAAAVILIAAVLNRHNGYTIWGAQLYFWGRLLYVPIYVAGLTGVRTLVWLVSIIGIVLVLIGAMIG